MPPSLQLLHSPADILRWMIVQKGWGSDPNEVDETNRLPKNPWPVYAASEPTTPDEVLTLYDTSNQDDGRSMISGEPFRHYGFQLRVRSSTHPIGYAKTNSLETLLNKEVSDVGVNIDQYHYLVYCVVKTKLLVIGAESPTSKRRLFTINGLACIVKIDL